MKDYTKTRRSRSPRQHMIELTGEGVNGLRNCNCIQRNASSLVDSVAWLYVDQYGLMSLNLPTLFSY